MRGFIHVNKICTFCKHWYDPTNSNIKPINPQIGLWEFEHNVKKYCNQRNLETIASATCKSYECKLK